MAGSAASTKYYGIGSALAILAATIALVLALLATGYSLNRPFHLSEIGTLDFAGLGRIEALDALFWVPGLYIVCWLALLDRARVTTNFYVVLLMTSLMACDAFDDVMAAGLGYLLGGVEHYVDLALSLALMTAAWLFVRRWPFRLTKADILNSRRGLLGAAWMRRTIGFVFGSFWLVLVSFVVANTSKIAALFGLTHLPIDQEVLKDIDDLGFALIVIQMGLVAGAASVIGSNDDRRRLHWALLSLLVFGGGVALSGVIDLFAIFTSTLQNELYVAAEWTFYALTLLTLLVGSIFSNLMSAAPLIRSGIIVGGVVGLVIFVVEKFSDAILAKLSDPELFRSWPTYIVLPALTLIGFWIMRRLDAALTAVIPDEGKDAP